MACAAASVHNYTLINKPICSKIHKVTFDKAALVGELAVPFFPQSATAGMNPRPRVCNVSSDTGKQC